MIRSLWIAKTGLDTQQTNLDVITNNLANSQTTAYKKFRPVFADLMYQNLRANGSAKISNFNSLDMLGNTSSVSSGLAIGNGSKVISTQRINSQGALVRSENPLDIALKGDGYFVVSPKYWENGEVAYTRAGNFMRDREGYIVTAAGDYVSGVDDGPIQIPETASSVIISENGVVTYYEESLTDGVYAGQIKTVNFVNPAGLVNAGEGLLSQSASSGEPVDGVAGENGFGTITQYYTEQSNVNIAEELVSLIAAQRAYEITTRSISASDSMLQKLGQL